MSVKLLPVYVEKIAQMMTAYFSHRLYWDLVSDCLFESASCINSCPCFVDCESGCENCPSEYCSCYDVSINLDFQQCKAQFEAVYESCLLGQWEAVKFQRLICSACSNGDYICYQNCARVFDENLNDCPCGEKCPAGCPCPSYDCDQTTTSLISTTGNFLQRASVPQF